MTTQQKREALARAVKSMLISGDLHFAEEDFEAETGHPLAVLTEFLSEVEPEIRMTVSQIESMVNSLLEELVPTEHDSAIQSILPLRHFRV